MKHLPTCVLLLSALSTGCASTASRATVKLPSAEISTTSHRVEIVAAEQAPATTIRGVAVSRSPVAPSGTLVVEADDGTTRIVRLNAKRRTRAHRRPVRTRFVIDLR